MDDGIFVALAALAGGLGIKEIWGIVKQKIDIISTLIKDGTENDGKLEELNRQLDELRSKKPKVIVKEVKVDKKGRKL